MRASRDWGPGFTAETAAFHVSTSVRMPPWSSSDSVGCSSASGLRVKPVPERVGAESSVSSTP